MDTFCFYFFFLTFLKVLPQLGQKVEKKKKKESDEHFLNFSWERSDQDCCLFRQAHYALGANRTQVLATRDNKLKW